MDTSNINHSTTNDSNTKTIYIEKPKSNNTLSKLFGCFTLLLLILICCSTSIIILYWSNLTYPKHKDFNLIEFFKPLTPENRTKFCEMDIVQKNKCSLLSYSLSCPKIDYDKECKSDTISSSTDSSTSANTSASTTKNIISTSQNIVPTLRNSVLTEKDQVNLIDEVSKSVVTIVASNQLSIDGLVTDSAVSKSKTQNIGSGFIIRSDGLIVTNAHVVDNENLEYSVLLPNETGPIPVKKIVKDPAQDIALIVIDKKNLPALKIGESNNLKKGQYVIAIGSSLGDLTGTVTSGIISGLNREVPVESGSVFSSVVRTFQGAIQTDAAINPGNSGGPLINSSGEVIGINFAINEGTNNIGFALPSEKLKLKLEEFDKYGRFLQPYVGVQSGRPTLYKLNNLYVYGIVISKIQEDSPAFLAGLLRGDVIIKIDNKSVEDISLSQEIQSRKVGDKIVFTIMRKTDKYEELQIVVEIKDRKN